MPAELALRRSDEKNVRHLPGPTASARRPDRRGLGHLEPDRVPVDDRTECRPVAEPPSSSSQRERVLDQPLDRPLQRPRAEGGIPARLGDQLDRLVRELERDLPLGEPPAQPLELQLDDLGDLLAVERVRTRRSRRRG